MVTSSFHLVNRIGLSSLGTLRRTAARLPGKRRRNRAHEALRIAMGSTGHLGNSRVSVFVVKSWAVWLVLAQGR